MKFQSSKKMVRTFALVFLSVIAGFIGSVFFLSNNSSREVESVYADAEIDNDLRGALSLQNTYRKISAKVLPVVVEIEAVEIQSRDTKNFTNPFNFFFGPNKGSEEDDDNPHDEGLPKDFRNSGLGSGILVRKSRNTYYVLTNNHVAGKADEITVKLYDDRSFSGKLVGTDERKDLALISFESKSNLDIGVLGDSDDLYVGDFVLAVGNPFGFQSTVTSGIISALGRQQGPDNNISDFIQTDASINQGNSGGALVNLKGEIIGINTWITTPTGGSIGLGFSIPINNAKKAIEDIMKTGSPEYGWLGVSIANVSLSFAENMNLESVDGAFVSQVFTNSPAFKGGVLPGDVITSINGQDTKNSNELLYLVGDISPGTKVKFELIRNNKKIVVHVTIEKRESEEEVSQLSNGNGIWPGVSLVPLNDEFRERLAIEEGLNGVIIYEVYPKTPLQVAGIKSGDVVTEINGKPVNDIVSFYNLINTINNFKFTYVREGVTLESSSIVRR